ncbi:MAG: (d)CMP kinase [Clostridia bacterium]
MGKTNKNYVIAVDGEPATGKSTLALALSKKLDILYIDTGAMFRAVAYFFLENKIEINEENVNGNIDKINIDFKFENSKIHVSLNKEDITSKIRTSEVSKAASAVAKYSKVRNRLVELQRNIACNQSTVLDGQDIGTVVFPNADLKIYLVTDIDERAKRRLQDLKKQNEEISIEQVKEDLEKRAKDDSKRAIAPIKKAADAIQIDSGENLVDSIVEQVVILLKRKDIV